jgi:hypothetical protein
MQTTTENADSSPRQRWPQFGLRHVFVLLTIAALVAAAAGGTFGYMLKLTAWIMIGFVGVFVLHIGSALLLGFLLASGLRGVEMLLRWVAEQSRGRRLPEQGPGRNSETGPHQ